MPTGYTSELHDGKPITRNEFILQCSRAMGAAIMQRDDSPKAPLRLPKFETDYSDERLAKAKADLDKYRAIPIELADGEAFNDYEAALARWREREQERRDMEGRYRGMLAEVAGWRPPTPDHQGLKDFMVEQLQSSIEFDCGAMDPPVPLTGEEYRDQKIAMAERDIEYHTRSRAESIERTKGRRDWITALADSLGVGIEDDVVVPT